MKKRFRQYMYTQDLDHLPFNIKSLQSLIKTEPLEEWAYIIHDKDKNDDNTPIRKHLHLVLKYKNPQTLHHISKLLTDKDQYFEIWNGRINNAYSYLIHATNEAREKYQYSPSEVTASFNFEKRISKIKDSISNSNNKVQTYIQRYAEEEISYKQLIDQIGLINIAKNKRLIDTIQNLLISKHHQEWLHNFEGKKMICLWLWGEAGVGKTTYAKKLLNQENYIVLGSSNDYFQSYTDESFAIINNLRPEDWKYADLLRLLDPYEHNKMAPSRYHDKELNLEMIIITTPYSPESFYKNLRIFNSKIDSFEQLERRIFPIHITPEFIRKEKSYGYFTN